VARWPARPATGDEPAARDDAGAADDLPGVRLRVVGGDVYADWDAVYRDNIDRMYRQMFRKVGNRADAEDLTTEVFLGALRPLRLPASVGEVRAYLQATARTVLARYWRRKLGQPVTELTGDVAAASTAPEPASAAPEQAEQILAALPERYRRILQLRFLDACSIAEAARAMGISVANAKVLQHRALRRAAGLAEDLGW
jgi:RNA polymerase sigma factor (sigma-70 family)